MEDSVFDKFRQSKLDYDPESLDGVTDRDILERILLEEKDEPLVAPLVAGILLLDSIVGQTREELMASIRDLIDGPDTAVAIRAETVLTKHDSGVGPCQNRQMAMASFNDFLTTYPQELRAMYAILRRPDEPELSPPGPRAKTIPLRPGKVLKFADPNEVHLVDEPVKNPSKVLPFRRPRKEMQKSA